MRAALVRLDGSARPETADEALVILDNLDAVCHSRAPTWHGVSRCSEGARKPYLFECSRTIVRGPLHQLVTVRPAPPNVAPRWPG